jgi:hypothetical protein
MNAERRGWVQAVGERTDGSVQTEHERAIVSALAAKYPVFAVSTIERWVAGATNTFASARIQKYVPVLVQRSVDATLSELSRTEGTSADLLSVSELTDPTARHTVILPDLGPWSAARSLPSPRR